MRPMKRSVFGTTPLRRFLIWHLATRWLWKLTFWTFSSAIFEMSKIEFPLRIQIFPKTTKLAVNEYLWALDMKRKFIFDISKIKNSRGKVHGVSFHNHLVARCHIKNWLRGVVPNTALAMEASKQFWPENPGSGPDRTNSSRWGCLFAHGRPGSGVCACFE